MGLWDMVIKYTYLERMHIEIYLILIWGFLEFAEYTNDEMQPMKETVTMLFLCVWDCRGKPVFFKNHCAETWRKKNTFSLFFCSLSFVLSCMCLVVSKISIYFSCEFISSPDPHIVLATWGLFYQVYSVIIKLSIVTS